MTWFSLHYRRLLIASSLGALAVLTAFGTALIWNALVIAFLTVLGFIMLFVKLPRSVRAIMLKHPLATDAALTAGCFIFFGTETVTSITAGAIVALAVSGLVLFFSEAKAALVA